MSLQKNIIFCGLVGLLLITSTVKLQETTVQIIGLLRSGNSFPEQGPVKKVVNVTGYTDDKQLFSEITGNGLRSTYILGQDLLNRYPFLGPSSKKIKNFSMIASKTNRTLMTAQAVMLGIFGLNNDTREVKVLDEFQQPPFNGETVTNSFDTPLPQGVYPVPFQSFNKEFNNVLRPWDKWGCKEFSSLNSDSLDDESTFIDKYDGIIQKIKNEVAFIIWGN